MTFLDFIMFLLDVILGHTLLTSPSYGSNVQTSSASHSLVQQSRRSDFVFYVSSVQTSPSYGSDVQTSSASHSQAQQIKRLDFVFCVSGIQTSPSYGLDV